jgi:hypothetical protein
MVRHNVGGVIGLPQARDSKPLFLWARIILCVLIIVLAVIRLLVPATHGIDATFLAMMVLAIALLLVPWERVPWDRLGAFKAFGVEVSLLEQPQVRGAVESIIDPNSLSLGEELRARLEDALQFIADDVEKIHGSRVLWVDDEPNTVLGERRLLRALGIEVVPATSSSQAEDLIERDAHFDLLISDVQRDGTSYEKLRERGLDAYPEHEGANFVVVWLRNIPSRSLVTCPSFSTRPTLGTS